MTANPTASSRVLDPTKLLKAKEHTALDPTTKETANLDCHESIITDEDEY